jgi:hypothetical protein
VLIYCCRSGWISANALSQCDRDDLDQPYDLSFGYFHLRRDRHLRVIATRDTRRAAASQLMGTQTRKNGELEAVRLDGTMNHVKRPPQQGFGEGWAGTA